MRRRPWVLVLAVFVFAMTFSMFILVRYINRSNWIRDRILQETTSLPGTIQIERARLLPTTLRLQNFKYIPPDSSFALMVEEVRLNINLGNLITTKEGG